MVGKVAFTSLWAITSERFSSQQTASGRLIDPVRVIQNTEILRSSSH